MFFFTKNKKRLKELIPQGMVDIHSHIMYGIDDGAKSEDDSLALITSMMGLGFGQCITTPHTLKNVWNNTSEDIQLKEQETLSILRKNSLDLPFKAASEYYMDAHLLQLLENGPLLTLKDYYVLVEMSYLSPPIQLYDILFAIQLAGYKPILAHPERYLFYHDSMEHYQKLKKSGCLFQLNLLSTTNYYGSKVTQTAQKLLKSGLIDFVGSDVHHLNHIKAFDNPIIFKDVTPLQEAIANNALFNFS